MSFLKSPSTRRFTATLAATATALALMTAAAIPARADMRSDDVAKALAAIAAVAIIGSALNDNNDRRATPVHQPRYKDKSHRKDRATVLPGQCAVEVRGRRHSSVAYIERCLRRNGIDQRLPRRCEVDLRVRGRERTAYDQDCLLDYGFRTQGRGRRY